MAEDDKITPLFEELYGKSFAVSEPADAQPGDMTPTNPVSDNAHSFLHRMHEHSIVRSAGHMVIGAKVPTPEHLDDAASGAVSTAIFYPREEKRSSPLGKSAAAALACAAIVAVTAAIGSYTAPESAKGTATAVLTGNEARPADSAPATAAPEQESQQPFQVLAISRAPNAAMRPAISGETELQPQEGAAGFVRVAQTDASGLKIANMSGQAGKPIRVPISLDGAKPEDYSFLMFRGLPTNVTLSAGFRLKESWAVSLRDLDNLNLETPAEYQGSFNLEVLLIKGRDTPAESRVVTVEILAKDRPAPAVAAREQPAPPGPQILTAAPRGPEPEQSAALGRPGPVPPPSVSRALPAPIPQEDAMIARANALLKSNDVAAARLLFGHLAKQGSAKAALAMAKTYDPAFLRNIAAAGLKPDVEKARQWYKQAADLGNQEAVTALSSLAQ